MCQSNQFQEFTNQNLSLRYTISSQTFKKLGFFRHLKMGFGSFVRIKNQIISFLNPPEKNFCANFFAKNIFAKILRKIFREKYFFAILAKIFSQKFSRKIFRGKKIKILARKYLRKRAHHFFRKILRKNFAQNFSAKKFATIFFAIINNYTFFLSEIVFRFLQLNPPLPSKKKLILILIFENKYCRK